MTAPFRSFVLLAPVFFTLGPPLIQMGSLAAAEPPPAAVELVDLAVTLPDVVNRVKLLEVEVEEAGRLNESGVGRASDLRRLTAERDAARQKLELLRMIIEAEIASCETRIKAAMEPSDDRGSKAEVEILTAQRRSRVLQRMLAIATDGAAAGEEATSSHKGKEARFSGRVMVVGNVGALEGGLEDSLIVGANDGLASVFIFPVDQPSADEVPISDEPVVLTSRNGEFHPRCAIVRTGQQVLLKNDERVLTNMHFSPTRNPGVNFGIAPNEVDGVPVAFQRPEPLPMRITDDIHPDKRAYLLVVDHPFAALTDEEGRFEIEGLPPGRHTFRLWHERAGFINREYTATIDEGGTDVEITVDVERLLSEEP